MADLGESRPGAGRPGDRRILRPPGLVSWLDDRPPLPLAFGLALQHLAIQSVYFVLPAAVAGALTDDPGEATRFLCLSILAAAAWQVLQLLPRGPVGSGYPIPGTHTAATLGAYLLVGAAGGGFGTIAALVLASGLLCVLLAFVMRRPRLWLPNEVAGVVVLLIGVALVVLGARQVGMQATGAGGGALPDPTSLGVILASMATMAGVALSRTRAAPFAVLIGALLGVVLSLALGRFAPNAAEVIAARPWVALPDPYVPSLEGIGPGTAAAFLLALVAVKATAFGSLVAIQRASDASWTRPDGPPIRRGMLANGLAIVAAGLIGGAAPGPATAAVGLSIATGTLARRIVWIGAGLLVVVALCPKLVALFVLVPDPVKAAMLFYVAGFIMAQGCQLVTARLLDTRRALIVAFGLGAGVAAAVAPQAFLAGIPALASPLAFGAMAAFLVHILTLPLVARRAEQVLPVDGAAARAVAEWFATVGGGWGLKRQTVAAAEHALTELMDLLAARRVREVTLGAALAEDRVEVSLAWDGPALPAPSARPRAEDLMGSDEAREAFAVWMATRQAQGFRQAAAWDGARTEARLAFED